MDCVFDDAHVALLGGWWKRTVASRAATGLLDERRRPRCWRPTGELPHGARQGARCGRVVCATDDGLLSLQARGGPPGAKARCSPTRSRSSRHRRAAAATGRLALRGGPQEESTVVSLSWRAKGARHGRTSTPEFYDPSQVASCTSSAAASGRRRAPRPTRRSTASSRPGQDKLRIAAFGIDVQVGFCTPGASLFVPGAVEDTTRTIEWLYRNLDRITGLFFSMDTHRVFQIFHPAWWIDDERQPPAAVHSGLLRRGARGQVDSRSRTRTSASSTAKKLEATGKYVLTIWPYHTLLGGLSHALVPALMEAAHLSRARAPVTRRTSRPRARTP